VRKRRRRKEKEEGGEKRRRDDTLHLYMTYASYYRTFDLSSDHFENNKQKSLLSPLFKPSSSLSLS
jgi:hypothetical protein